MRSPFLISLLLSSFAHAEVFSIQELTIRSVHHAITSRQVSCEQIVQKYIERIKKFNLDLSRGAPLNAIVELNPSVLEDARQLDQNYEKNRKLAGPLHCVTVLLKDNIDSFDTPSTSGSLSLLGSQPDHDAFIVDRMRKAGALILGKASMDEFASGLSGISGRSGRTGNSYDPNTNSGGSSAGSAVGVSANFALVSIGSDNSGSLRIPAAYNGLYTVRPTTGLLSQTGVFPRGSLDGVAGPMTRTVTDLAVLLDTLAASDSRDLKTHTIQRPETYTSFLKLEGLKGKRIGVLRTVAKKDQFRKADPETLRIYEQALSQLTRFGAIVVKDIDLAQFNMDRKNNMSGEVEEVNEYLSSFPSTRRDYSDICKSGRTRLAGGVKECLAHVKDTPKKRSQKYESVLKLFEKNRAYVENTMDRLQLDVLLTPVDSLGAAKHGVSSEGINCLVSSNAGLPSLSFIAGYTDGGVRMPVGLELIGRKFSESMLIEIAYSFEQQVQARIPPALVETDGSPEFLSSLSIPQLNQFFRKIGWVTYEKVLKSGKSEDLTAEVFQKIVRDILVQ